MKRILLCVFAMVMMLTTVLRAQNVALYSFAQSSSAYTEITGGTLMGTTSSDDQRFVDPATSAGGTTLTGVGFPIGFNFTYTGLVFDRIAINNNGWISLGQSALTPSVNITSSSSYTPMGSTTAITPTQLRSRVGGFARDLQAQAGATLRVETIGTAPNRTCVIQWKGYRRYLVTGDNVNYQIRLNETSNSITFAYGTNAFSSTDVAQVFIGGSAATDFNCRTTTTNWNATTAGATNSANCSFSTVIFPASGLNFTYTPPPVCSGTPTGNTLSSGASQTLCAGVTPAVINSTSSAFLGLSHQWQTSTDNATWSNVSAGTGGTTTNYTPPAASGSLTYYRVATTCSVSGLVGASVAATINAPAAPLTQAVIPTFSENGNFGVSMNMTAGSGNGRYLVINSVNSFTSPTGNAAPAAANLAYSGSGEQIVFVGTGTMGTITGLDCGSTYYFRIYEYLNCSGTYYYNTTGSAVSVTFGTASIPYSQNFEGVATAGAMPAGWGRASANFSGVNFSSLVHGNAGSKGATFNCYIGITTNNLRTEKILNVPTLCRLTFVARTVNYFSNGTASTAPAAGYGTIKVQVSTNCGSTWTDALTMGDDIASLSFSAKTVDLSAYAGQAILVRWLGTWTAGDWFFDLDNVVINPGYRFYQDADADSYGNIAVFQDLYAATAPAPPSGYVANATDCNDAALLYADADGDTYGAGSPVACGIMTNTDCDDTRADVNPAGTETCDAAPNTDEDCDGASDDMEVGDNATGQMNYYADTDVDGYGAGAAMNMCDQPAGSLTDNTDCDDTRADVSPVGTETCDAAPNTDEDCDGASDDMETGDNATGQMNYYTDTDADGFGAGAVMVMCDQPAMSVLNIGTDCQPNDALSYPGSGENLCDGIDNDCNGLINDLPAGVSCIAVNGGAVSGITKTRATISWSYQCGPSQTRVQYRKASSNVWTYSIALAPTIDRLIYNLTGATEYRYRLRNTCGLNTLVSSLTPEAAFTTLAADMAPETADVERAETARTTTTTTAVRMYPNPAEGMVFIELNDISEQTVSIQLFDQNGKSAITWNAATTNGSLRTQFDAANLPSGVYVVRMNTTEGSVLRTIIKQ